jgi:hypothetical protein
MTTLKTIAAAAAFAALTATPVFAQAAIQEPGLFAFYHPNLDVLNGGAPTPAARLEAQGLTPLQAAQVYNNGFYHTRHHHRAR